jgi:hypothetical protein
MAAPGTRRCRIIGSNGGHSPLVDLGYSTVRSVTFPEIAG